jgi:hypothetical protein
MFVEGATRFARLGDVALTEKDVGKALGARVPCLAAPTTPCTTSAASSSRTLSMLRSVRAARRRGVEGGV